MGVEQRTIRSRIEVVTTAFEIADSLRVSRHVTSHQAANTVPLWVGAMSTGVDYNLYDHRCEENGDFCAAVGPATRTAGILTQSVEGAGC